MASNPFQIPGFSFTLNAGADLTWHRFLKVEASGEVVYATADTDNLVGISQIECKKGQPMGIMGNGISFVEAGVAIPAGSPVTAGPAGVAVMGTKGINPVALTEAANVGDLICVKF